MRSLQNLTPAEERMMLPFLAKEFTQFDSLARINTASLLCEMFAQTSLDPVEIQQNTEIQASLPCLIEEAPRETKTLLKFASPNNWSRHLLAIINTPELKRSLALWEEAKRRHQPSEEVRCQVLAGLCQKFEGQLEQALENITDFEMWRAISQSPRTDLLSKCASSVRQFLGQAEIASLVKAIFNQALELGLDATALDLWNLKLFDVRTEQSMLMSLLNLYMKQQKLERIAPLLSQLKPEHVKDSALVDFINKKINDAPPKIEVACRLFLFQRNLKNNAMLNALLNLSKTEEETRRFKELADQLPDPLQLVLHPQFSTHYTEKEQLAKIGKLLRVSKERVLMEMALDLAPFWDAAFLNLFFSYFKENKTKTTQAFTKNEAQLIDQVLNKAPERFEDFLDICQKLGVTPKLSEEQAPLCLERVPHSLRVSQILRKKSVKQPERFISLINFLSENRHDAEVAAWIEVFHEQKAAPIARWILGLSDYSQKLELMLLCSNPENQELKGGVEEVVRNRIKTHFSPCLSLVEAFKMMNENLMELFVAAASTPIVDLVCRYPQLPHFAAHILKLVEKGENFTLPQIETFLASAPATRETSQTAKRLVNRENLPALQTCLTRLVAGLMGINEYDEAASWALIFPFESAAVEEVLRKGTDNKQLAHVMLSYRGRFPLSQYAEPLVGKLIKESIPLAISLLTAFRLMTRDKAIEIILRAKSGDSDSVFEMFSAYFSTFDQDTLEAIAPSLTVLSPSPRAAYSFINQNRKLPPFYPEFRNLLHLLFEGP